MICISYAISPTPSPISNPKLYEAVCEGDVAINGNKQRCLKLLESNSKITSAKDYLTLSKLYLEMAKEKATKGQNYLKSLIKKYPFFSSPKNLCKQKLRLFDFGVWKCA